MSLIRLVYCFRVNSYQDLFLPQRTASFAFMSENIGRQIDQIDRYCILWIARNYDKRKIT